MVEGPVTYDFTLHFRIHDHTTWFWRCLGTAFGTLSFGLSQSHGHGSWLVCKVTPRRNIQMHVFRRDQLKCSKFVNYLITIIYEHTFLFQVFSMMTMMKTYQLKCSNFVNYLITIIYEHTFLFQVFSMMTMMKTYQLKCSNFVNYLIMIIYEHTFLFQAFSLMTMMKTFIWASNLTRKIAATSICTNCMYTILHEVC